ncbi:transporter [Streptomyces sp. A7024]|uniref:Transporter n=1 Tax=Streptomyces coryli TaxID=1128680 RepID=A0A6G4TZK7_9ACTN|nr:TrkA C-terminal domain-containing protein [Streptomyces coryli]NGN65263.1 transporter [Streptomyces coryli]
MWGFLADNPYVTLFAVITAGSLLGLVRFGPVVLGPAGVLFVGLLVGALDPAIGKAAPAALGAVGLAFYVYTVGLESGPAFFRELRPQLTVMAGAVAALVVTAAAVGWLGSGLLGIPGGYLAGGYAGIGTTTPGLAAAQAAAEKPEQPAVGYAIGYPLAVVLAILAIAFIAGRSSWGSAKDPGSPLPRRLIARTIRVDRAAQLRDVPEIADGRVLISVMQPAGAASEVALDARTTAAGDRMVLVGGEEAVAAATERLGALDSAHLLDDRSQVDYRRILLTNPDLAGHTLGDLRLAEKYGAMATRLRRGDQDLLAHDDLVVQLDDRIRVAMPRERTREVTAYLGDVEARVSQVSAVSLGLGLTLGFLIGIPSVTLGGSAFALGTAAGPLIAGMVLGRLRRTGPIVWTLPTRANLTLRQIGLLLFLAVVGITSGDAFRKYAFTALGGKLVLLLTVTALLSYGLFSLAAKLLGQSRERTTGLLAGYVGNPALLAYANGRVHDSRVNTGYATLFALAILVKIACIQVIVAL